MMTITPGSAVAFINDCLDAGEIPCFIGGFGVGKSQTYEQAAASRKSGYHIMPIGLWQIEDLTGVPGINARDRTVFKAPDLGIFADDPIDRELIVHLEEINHAGIQMQGAIYEMFLNRTINNKPIHPLVRFVASGNPQSARAAANHLSTALRSRMIMARFENTSADWLIEANRIGVDPLIIGYINMAAARGDESALNGFDPKAEGNTPNPRGWVKASNLWTVMEDQGRDLMSRTVTLAGAVGESRAVEFVGFVRMWNALPDLSGVASDPDNAPLPNMKVASSIYASLTWLAFNATRKSFDAYITYTGRLGAEYTAVMINMATARDDDLKNTQAYSAWGARTRSRSV